MFNKIFGIVLLSIVFLLIGCGEDEMNSEVTCSDGIQNGNEVGVDCGGDCADCPSTAEFYFRANVDGADLSINGENQLSAFSSGGTLSGVDACNVSYTGYIGDFFQENRPVVQLSFNNVFQSNMPCNTDVEVLPIFATLFPVGTYEFLSNTGGLAANRILISYIDIDNKTWRSDQGDQGDESVFEVTATESISPELDGRPVQKVSGSVNCTLYDNDGNSILLKSGVFVYRFAYI